MAFCNLLHVEKDPPAHRFPGQSRQTTAPLNLSQLELVGMKCSTKRGWRWSLHFHFRVLVGAVIVDHQVQFYFLIRELVIQDSAGILETPKWRWRG